MAADEAPWRDAARGADEPGQICRLVDAGGRHRRPVGAGKSTVARGVARALGCRYLDTGAIYRALTWAVLERGTDPADEPGVAEVLSDFRLQVSTDPDDVDGCRRADTT